MPFEGLNSDHTIVGTKLGSRVADKYSNKVGVILSATLMLDGCIRYVVDDGVSDTRFHMYESQVKHEEEGKELEKQEYEVHPFMGKEVTDSVTGITGTVTGHVHSLLHAQQLVVQPKGMTKDGEPIQAYGYDTPRIYLKDEPKEKAPVLDKGKSGPTAYSEEHRSLPKMREFEGKQPRS